MFLKSLFIFVALFFSAPVWALTPAELSAAKIEQYLKIDPVYYTEGSFKGRAIDQTIKRPVRLIPELETEESYFISHFYNQKQFWVAEVPKRGVKHVITQIALFKGPLYLTLGHMQFRFLMHKSKAVKLYRVKDGIVKTTRTGDLIFTVQAALPAGEEYSAIKALGGTYKMAARLANTHDRVIDEEVRSGDIVTQYAMINMTDEQKDLLLLNGIEFSSDNLYERDYIATTENCISVAFDILDESLSLHRKRVTLNLKNMFFNGKSPNEKMILEELRSRRLIGKKSRIENYN